MPCTSAVRAVASTSITPVRPETSSPGAVVAARGRKRLDVFLASRTGALRGMAAYDARRRSTAAACWSQAPPVVTPDNLLPLGVGSVSRGPSGGECLRQRALRVTRQPTGRRRGRGEQKAAPLHARGAAVKGQQTSASCCDG